MTKHICNCAEQMKHELWRLTSKDGIYAPCAICKKITSGMVTIELSNAAVCDKPECQFLKEYEDDDCIDGRWMEAVNVYASTCDGCQELTMHETMLMDAKTQLGYCEECVKKGNILENMEVA